MRNAKVFDTPLFLLCLSLVPYFSGCGKDDPHAAETVIHHYLREKVQTLDPAEVGRLVAGLHRAGPPAEGPVDNWFSSMVPEPAWEELLTRLRDAGAPFARSLEQFVDVLLSVSADLEPPRRRLH